MANFEQAYLKTAQAEGGYANDPNDYGGETYCGISRVHHPAWFGWKIIDAHKQTPKFPAILATLPELSQRVKSFYKQVFWDTIWGDLLPDQNIAEELYDTSVNCGLKVKYLQTALNVLNRNGTLYFDIQVDNRMGNQTLEALQSYGRFDRYALLYKVMNILQGAHYIEIMQRDQSQEGFARGWLKRVKFMDG
jgi:lysozyme family protein